MTRLAKALRPAAFHRNWLLCAFGAVLAGCLSAPTNPQSPTATEILLPRHAARAAAAQANMMCREAGGDHCVPVGARVFIETLAGDETPAGKFAVYAFRQHLGGAGAAIVDDKAAAQVVVELAILCAGIDEDDLVVGVPPMAIPAVPGKTSSTTTTPELSLYSRHTRTGVVELEARAVDATTRRTITAVGPLAAEATLQRGSILTAIGFGQVRERPGVVARRP